MKKLFLFLFIFICAKIQAQTYNPSQGKVAINLPMGLNLGASLDSRSMFYDAGNFVYRAYTDTGEVNKYLNLAKYRTGFFPIWVNTGGTLSGGVITGGTNIPWIYKDGVGNGNLVRMLFDSTYIYQQLRGKLDTIYTVNDSTVRIQNGNTSYTLLIRGNGGNSLNNYTNNVVFDTATGRLTTKVTGRSDIITQLWDRLRPSQAGLFRISGTYPYYTFTSDSLGFEGTLAKSNTTSQNDSINIGAFRFKFQGTSALGIPWGNTASRPTNPQQFDLRGNLDSLKYEFWNGSTWISIGNGGAGGSGITALSGDGTASGTGSVTFTLATVNSNIFGSNTFLKFSVNAKGLITAATTVGSSDITAALGYTPYNATNPAGYGTGNPNANLGSGYRIAIPGTNNLKTITGDYIIIDSATANQLKFKVDTASLFTLIRAMPINIPIDTVNGLRKRTGSGSNPDTLYIAYNGGGGGAGTTLNNVIDSKAYGITDGMDATAKIQAGIDSLASLGGGRFYITNKTLNISPTSTQKGIHLRSNVFLIGSNTLMTITGNSPVFSTDFGTDSLGFLITADVTDSTSKSVTVSSSSGLSVGDTVFLRLGTAPYDAGEPYRYGWFIVKTIVSNVVTLDKPVGGVMTVSSTSTLNRRLIRVHNLPTNVLVQGFRFTSPQSGGAIAEAGAYLQGGWNITLKDIYGTNMGAGTFIMQFVDNGIVDNVNTDVNIYAGNANFGRGGAFQECRNTVFKNSYIKNCQSAFFLNESANIGCGIDNIRFISDSVGRKAIVSLGSGQFVASNCAFEGQDFQIYDQSQAYGNLVLNNFTVRRGTKASTYPQLLVNNTGYMDLAGDVYEKKKTFTYDFKILSGGVIRWDSLPRGIYTNVNVKVSDTTGITNAYFYSLNDFSHNTGNFKSDLRSGLGVFPSSLGSFLTYGTGVTSSSAINQFEEKGFEIDGPNGLTGTLSIEYLEKSNSTKLIWPNYTAYYTNYGSSGGSGITDTTALARKATALTVNGQTGDISTNRTFNVTDSNLGISDITTNNASTSKHGFLPKLPSDSNTVYTPAGFKSTLPVILNNPTDGQILQDSSGYWVNRNNVSSSSVRRVNMIVGAGGAPANGDKYFTDTLYKKTTAFVYREGELQYPDTTTYGAFLDTATGKWTFYPPLITGEHLVFQSNSAGSSSSTGPALVDLNFATQVGLTNTSGVWTGSNSGSLYANYGLADKKLAAGTDGYIMFQYPSTDGERAVLTFNTSNVNEMFQSGPTYNYEAGAFMYSGSIYVLDNNLPAGSVTTVSPGNYFKIERIGSTLKLYKSTDGVTWGSSIYTYTFSSTADLFINCNIDESLGTAKLYYPKGYNLQ